MLLMAKHKAIAEPNGRKAYAAIVMPTGVATGLTSLAQRHQRLQHAALQLPTCGQVINGTWHVRSWHTHMLNARASDLPAQN